MYVMALYKVIIKGNKMKTVLRNGCLMKKLVNTDLFARKMRKLLYVSRLLPLHQWKKATVNCARDITIKV